MKTIKFTHRYCKLGKPGMGAIEDGDTAQLLQVFECNRNDLSPAMISADTVYIVNGEPQHYELPKGKLLFLLFMNDNGYLFPTIRSGWRDDKRDYYKAAMGEMFRVEIKEGDE